MSEMLSIETQDIDTFTESAYLNYAMYVILDRALPHIGDGLKPVQRRIVYAMSELGLHAAAKYKKSARTVGDVLGKFHPHSDTACYEAMVLLAQPFSYRYPLIDGQGNWGSMDDPKSFAAMRYTEARLSKYAQLYLKELSLGTVDWGNNFDGTLKEPKELPARLPTLLLNGTTGIAVGMATNVPPHNLTETGNACIHLLENPNATIKDLCKIMPGPDFPSKAEITTSKKELIETYSTGLGSVKARGIIEDEGTQLIVTAIPYQTSGARILEQIAKQMQLKKIPMVVDLRDESDHENPVRLIIVLKSNRVDKTELMNHLFATTDLARSYRVNMNVIGLNGKPEVKNLREFLTEWLTFRVQTVTRRLKSRLEKVNQRLHILEGFITAFLNMDEVIKIIRESEEPKKQLIKKFKLSELQADAILDLKLRHLAKLEEIKIQAEQKELNDEREQIELTLGSKQRMNTLVKKEIKEDIKEYGDKRLSPMVEREDAKPLELVKAVINEPISIVLSDKGWIRAAKSHEIDPEKLSYKSGDSFGSIVLGYTDKPVFFLDTTGRSYAVQGGQFPSARGQGEPITGFLTPPAGAHINSMIIGEQNETVALISSLGYGFQTTLENFLTRNKAGKALFNVDGAKPMLLGPLPNTKQVRIAIVTDAGHLIVFDLSEVPVLPKGKGQKLISIPKAKQEEEQVVGAVFLKINSKLVIHAGKRKLVLKPKDIDHYLSEKGKRGLKLPRGVQKVTDVEVE